MEGKLHLTPKGQVRVCHARKVCPYGEENHFSTFKEALSEFEKRMKNSVIPKKIAKSLSLSEELGLDGPLESNPVPLENLDRSKLFELWKNLSFEKRNEWWNKRISGIEYDYDYYGPDYSYSYEDDSTYSVYEGLRVESVNFDEVLKQLGNFKTREEVPEDFVTLCRHLKLDSVDGYDMTTENDYYGETAVPNLNDYMVVALFIEDWKARKNN